MEKVKVLLFAANRAGPGQSIYRVSSAKLTRKSGSGHLVERRVDPGSE